MSSRTSNALTVALLVAPLIFAACAKRPVITGASAPAPVGAAVAQPAAPQQSAVGQPQTPAVRADQVPLPTERGLTTPSAEGPRGSTTAPPVVSGPATSMPTSPATPSQTTGPMAAAPSSPQPSGPAMAAAPPPTARALPKEFVEVAELRDVYFDFDRSDIRDGDAKTLDASAGWLKTNAEHLVLIEGHCDERGTNEYNLSLGERRARAAQNYLIAQGVQASRITIISYGEERPVCTEHNEDCWSKNRRAHFLVKPR